MASFKRLRLMQDEEYNRLRQKQVTSVDSEARLIARLEDESRDVMSSDKLTDGEKVAMLNHLRIRMEDLRNKEKAEIEVVGISKKLPGLIVPIAAAAVAPAAVAANVPLAQVIKKEDSSDIIDLNSNLLLSNIVSKNQSRASKLLELMKANPKILTLNDKLEVVVNGKSIVNSNFLEMFEGLFNTKKKTSFENLPGIHNFLEGLNSINESKKLITNSYFQSELKVKPSSTFESLLPSSSSSSSSLSTNSSSSTATLKKGDGLKTPGRIQRILRLYRV